MMKARAGAATAADFVCAAETARDHATFGFLSFVTADGVLLWDDSRLEAAVEWHKAG